LIDIGAFIRQNCLRITFTYSKHIHRRQTIEAIAGGALMELEAAADSSNKRTVMGTDYLATVRSSTLETIIKTAKAAQIPANNNPK